ncbi:dihydroneopterin aldolase [Helicobacter pylori]|nr:dihydroneopterin aldolase [Helicobacter pylori]
MKIFLSCKSLLSQRSLEFYLSDCLSPMEVCDFVLSDDETLEINKPLCFIEEHLRKPFTKQSVKEDVKNFYHALHALKESEKPCEEIQFSKEQKIQQLLEEYTQKLCQIISQ